MVNSCACFFAGRVDYLGEVMNIKLLKELYKQAETECGWSEEKFAELIVRECALVAKTLPHTPERAWVLDSVTYIPVHCEQNILKHFGVEE
jgi:hypothetical protein